MNEVTLLGRLTADPATRYRDNLAITTFSLAIDRPPKPDGTKETDFPFITVYGKLAEFCEKYLAKGKRAAVLGRIRTSSYEKDGQRIYKTDIIATRVEVIDWPEKATGEPAPTPQRKPVDSGGWVPRESDTGWF